MTNTYSSPFISELYFMRQMLRAGLVIVLWLGVGHASANTLPSIANHQSYLISQSEEHHIGQLVAGNLNRAPTSKALAIRLWLTDLVRPLLNHSSLSDKQLQIFLVNNKSINAFAAPGGVIGVHTGLILQTRQVDELVAVLAHEIAHISQRHYAHRLANEKSKAPIYFGAFLASMALATQVDVDLGEAGLHATQAALIRDKMGYSRAHEQEADRVGLALMQAAGFDVNKMLSMLNLLDSPFVEQDPNWAWSRSHPISEERVADLASRIEQLPAHKSSEHYQMDFQLLRLMLATELNDATKQSLSSISQQLDPLDDKYALYQQFATAMVHLQQQHWHAAAQMLAPLAELYPTQAFIWDRWMQALLAQGNNQAVITYAQEYVKLGFHRSLAYYYLARASAAQDDMHSAYRYLDKLMLAQPLWIGGWEMLAQWSGQAADLSTHRVAMAQWHLLRSEFEQAKEQALLGQQLATTSDAQRQQLADILNTAKTLTATAARL
ncbi:MAG: M48 family metalloprotease [Gammaproteobacteria bacterium]|jgi:predicted Zn-dependent protease|nr:M48 family metalloprotease [Gammaproteobacteria bacterium]